MAPPGACREERGGPAPSNEDVRASHDDWSPTRSDRPPSPFARPRKGVLRDPPREGESTMGEGGREASLFQGRPTGHLCKRGRRRQRDEGRLTRFDPLYWTSLSSETREPSAWSPASAGCGTMGVTLLTKELREQNTQTKALSAVTRAMRERIEGKQY